MIIIITIIIIVPEIVFIHGINSESIVTQNILNMEQGEMFSAFSIIYRSPFTIYHSSSSSGCWKMLLLMA